MFDKFEARRQLGNEASAYKWYWWANDHHARYRRHVEARNPRLVCQECGGSGGEIDNVIGEFGAAMGPWEECGWCEGTGYVTPWIRGHWLRYQREKRLAT